MEIAAGGHVVEVRPEEAIEHQEDQPDGDRRKGQEDEELHDQRHPREQRHAHEREAGGTKVQDGDDEVDGGDQRGGAQDLQAHQPEIDAGGRRELPRGEIGVAEPAGVGRRAAEKAGVQEQAAGQEDPERERVQSRERDVARADLQRHQVIEQGRAERHDRQEHHGRAVHGEQRVERLGAHHMRVGARQLQADQQRLDPPEEKEAERADAVHDPDALVVRCCNECREPGEWQVACSGSGMAASISPTDHVEQRGQHHFKLSR